ncbi:hypothetical protein PDQ74_18760 [Bacillus cereus group sp. Bc005]|nr:hypothetical protein [Bacillus cereus group sp. Bc237]MDA2198895.1 hypothetical protein [Bacillus cereus group sp. Bc237]MDA2759106.1 hypothetical protein [Bacillus cereus group sp. Bc007]MDA2775771.1 hypothetical protein [Bacillus cereus group sp. Bc005]
MNTTLCSVYRGIVIYIMILFIPIYITGVLLYTNQMKKITAFFIRLFGGFTGF